MFDRRMHGRHSFVAPVEVFWRDLNGGMSSAQGSSSCISIYGMSVQLPIRLPNRTEVQVRVNGVDIECRTTVQYSKPASNEFHIGLQFDSTLLLADVRGLEEAVMGSQRPKERKHKTQVIPLTRPWVSWRIRKLLGVFSSLHL